MHFLRATAAAVVTAGFLSGAMASMAYNYHNRAANPKWMSGDFHQHTLYTDGKTSFDFVMSRNNQYGLDWWANSEHGGTRTYDGDGHYFDDQNWYAPGTILGDYRTSSGHQVMYRWQSLRDFVWPDIIRARREYRDKRIASGVEWNVPGHEHCSVGIIADNSDAVSAFEFQFDKSDPDQSRVGEMTLFGPLVKTNGLGKPFGDDRHADAVAACKWMHDQKAAGFIDDAWIIFAHIERKGAFKSGSSDGGYNVEHFRDFNNAAPDICFGFEGIPGHQQNADARGGFGSGASGGGTYGGAGYYTATIGGLWDALLGEGRHWFNFASSDYHLHWTKGGDDYYPGEYQKTWSFVEDLDENGRFSLDEIAQSLRSGNCYNVMGDLIDKLEFEATTSCMIPRHKKWHHHCWKPVVRENCVAMGDELHAHGPINDLELTIRFHSPKFNNFGDSPVVDHIDLIAGDINGKIDPSSPDYSKATNESAQIVARFTSDNWIVEANGDMVVRYTIPTLAKSMYFRLRGTNMAPNTEGETDADGNPLLDVSGSTSGNEQAWSDLWFYGNPIFVYTD